MPREIRKRGKKHKKALPEDGIVVAEAVQEQPFVEIQQGEDEGAGPFGFVDADVKAYFRTVDATLASWGEVHTGTHLQHGKDSSNVGIDDDQDNEEERRLFFSAALHEMRGKELQLATDPDCAVVLERMLISMDDFSRRVFMDSLSASYLTLSKHRFASHVCQSCFQLARSSVEREMRDIYPPIPGTSKVHNLRTVTQLVVDSVQELIPHLHEMVIDPFATHVLRCILTLLSPALDSTVNATSHSSNLRSKKSTKWKNKQAPLISIFGDKQQFDIEENFNPPQAWASLPGAILSAFTTGQGGNEIRSLAISAAASPTLQLMARLESLIGVSSTPESLLDHILDGLVSQDLTSTNNTAPSDYVRSLIRDPTASHLMETVIDICPPSVFSRLWETYFVNQLRKLAPHPVSNFIVAKCISRLSLEPFERFFVEMESLWPTLVRNGRGGILNASVEQARTLGQQEDVVVLAIRSAFECTSRDGDIQLLDSVLAFQNTQKSSEKGPSVQGALLLQSMLKLNQPHNNDVITNVNSLDSSALLRFAQDPVSSRILDCLLESETVPQSDKRKLVLTFVGHYHELVDSRIGSRVGERCWKFADLFTREKIARSVLPHEQAILQSYYGKYFARIVRLPLLRRNASEWKESQKLALHRGNDLTAKKAQPSLSKRKKDDIDELFADMKYKRHKNIRSG